MDNSKQKIVNTTRTVTAKASVVNNMAHLKPFKKLYTDLKVAGWFDSISDAFSSSAVDLSQSTYGNKLIQDLFNEKDWQQQYVHFTALLSLVQYFANTSPDFKKRLYDYKVIQDNSSTTAIVARPTAILQLLDSIHISQAPTVTTETWKGKEVELVHYSASKPDDPELMVAYPKGLIDSEMFRTVSHLYGYANDISAKPYAEHAIIFNDFLDWLGYKRGKDNTHDIKNKKTVWKDLYNASRTPIRTQFGYLIKRNSKDKKFQTHIFEKELIEDLQGVYIRDGKSIRTQDYQETPPDTIIVKFVDFFITQLQGKKLPNGEWIPKNATLSPKIEMGLTSGKYQGYAIPFLEYVFLQLKINPAASGIRNFTKEELTKRASQITRPDMALNKTIGLLDLFEQDGHIKRWGFRQTLKGKLLSKKHKESSYVWIDFNDTDTLKKIQDFKGGGDNTDKNNKTIARLEGQITKLEKGVTDLERKNKEYGI
jgi:hypothetical protein